MTTQNIPDGVWPTMLTPFTSENRIDYLALEALVEWYIEKGVHGLFAVCQSSEMFTLSLAERVEIARCVKAAAADRVPVIASGHISTTLEEQVDELNAIAHSGVEAVVLISNAFAQPHEPDDVWKSNLVKLLRRLPGDIPLGFYECPAPYKRLFAPELLRWVADTGRFWFLKDTSCNIDQIKARLAAIQGTQLKLYNANAATLLQSLKAGAAGYSGVMANFHPELYVWLAENWRRYPEQGNRLARFLSLASVIEGRAYPVSAKYAMQLAGIPMTLHSRVAEMTILTPSFKLEVEDLLAFTQEYQPYTAN